jgi:hypothetical protein
MTREAVRHLEEALRLGERHEEDARVARARCLLASLSVLPVEEARQTVAKLGQRIPVARRMEIRFLLHRTAGDPADLAEAGRLLWHLRHHAPPEYRESMVRAVPLHREISRAWDEQD